jgi:hypothetical protein
VQDGLVVDLALISGKRDATARRSPIDNKLVGGPRLNTVMGKIARNRGDRDLRLPVSEILPAAWNRLPAVVRAAAVPDAGAVRPQLHGVPPTSGWEGVLARAENHRRVGVFLMGVQPDTDKARWRSTHGSSDHARANIIHPPGWRGHCPVPRGYCPGSRSYAGSPRGALRFLAEASAPHRLPAPARFP